MLSIKDAITVILSFLGWVDTDHVPARFEASASLALAPAGQIFWQD
jgi:hypothetical protein